MAITDHHHHLYTFLQFFMILTTYLSLETKITIWNIASINTSIPCLYSFIQQEKLAILLLQETKITTKKPPKDLQKLFPNYRLIFNNTNKITQRPYYPDIDYRPLRGGLLTKTLIHNKYNFSTNVIKTEIEPNLIPYLQIVKINNHPLTQTIIINIYMPSHQEDQHLIPNILEKITTITNRNYNHIIIIGGDFNRDIAFIGCTSNYTLTPPNEINHQWHRFITKLDYQYINTNTTYNRQGGNNYSNTSLIDGFYIYNSTPTHYTSHQYKLSTKLGPLSHHIKSPPNYYTIMTDFQPN